jgi:2-dehydro-3-deoxyphosphogluconate aldolase/(4S)-4-hydroxy-2-oxoglutarate aldolase
MKAIGAPFRGIRFVPTGGISPANLPEYMCLPVVHACGGSWLVAESLLTAREFGRIERLAAEAVAMVSQARAVLVS